MPATDLLIDGYNLLHAAGFGRVEYALGDLQRARQRLLKKLFQLLSPAEIAHAAVVFDAKQPPAGLPKNWYIHGLRVMYAQPYGDADEMLELLIQQHSAPRRLTVVSSDHRLHRAAKSRRATAIDSDEFLEHLERRHPNPETADIPDPPPTSPKATGEATSTELAYWIRFFGDIKVSELAEPTHIPAARTQRSSSTPAGMQITPPTPATQRPIARPFQTKPPKSRSPRRTRSERLLDLSSSPLNGDSDKSAHQPELFSDAWIEDLQRWTDSLQHPKS